MFKRLFTPFTLLAVLAVCASCVKSDYDGNYGIYEMKYVDKITLADGTSVAYSYDDSNRVYGIDVTDSDGQVKKYTITYNIVRPYTQSYIDIYSSDSQHWIMHFNNDAMLESWSSVNGTGTESRISSFRYEYSTRRAHVRSIEMEDKSIYSTFGWSDNVLYQQKLEYRDGEGQPAGSTDVSYRYIQNVSNILTNADLFMILVPEYFAASGIEPYVAAAVTVYGARSYYLPTSVSLLTKDNAEEESAPQVEVRYFSYDTDSKGYIQRIYLDEGDTRTQLCEISYFTSSSL